MRTTWRTSRRGASCDSSTTSSASVSRGWTGGGSGIGPALNASSLLCGIRIASNMRPGMAPGNRGAPPGLPDASLTRRAVAARLRDAQVPERAGRGDLAVDGRAVDQGARVLLARLHQRTCEFVRVLRANTPTAQRRRQGGEVGRDGESIADAHVAREGVD